ncbi:MAG: LPS export ABC transporter ATP-binding protein [Deltaproteobacteria bacterium]|nr:MAG: LPS export ABC transporter ATP-binding protein [Deltaproteobacteria bacterium]
MPGDAVLEARGLRKSYRGRTVVDGLGLKVKQGEVVGLLGPNGAGKTTTFHMLMGLIRPEAGRVILDGVEITRWPMHRRARAGLGFLAQQPSVFRRLSVRDNLRLVMEENGIRGNELERVLEETLEKFELAHLADATAGSCSGGERRRVEIARAMVVRPRFLLLDEPFSGIDPLTLSDIRRQVVELARSGLGLLITDHNVRETLSSCDRAYIVSDGRVLAEGTPQHLVQNEAARRLYLGEEFSL